MISRPPAGPGAAHERQLRSGTTPTTGRSTATAAGQGEGDEGWVTRVTGAMAVRVAALLVLVLLVGGAHAEAGLYELERDTIAFVDHRTVDQYIQLAPHGEDLIVLEFYAHWCGHCQNFAPIVKALARDIIGWRPTVRLGALDCGNDVNAEVCAAHGIQGYPTIKVFSRMASVNNTVIEESRDIDTLEASILRKLTFRPPRFQDMGELSADKSADPGAALVVLVVDGPGLLSVAVALDALGNGTADIAVFAISRRLRDSLAGAEPSLQDSTAVTNDTLALFYSGGTLLESCGAGATHLEVFRLAGTLLAGVQAGHMDADSIQRARPARANNRNPRKSRARPAATVAPANFEHVNRSDLIRAISYALRSEIATKLEGTAEQQFELRRFVHHLCAYTFLSRPVTQALCRLDEQVGAAVDLTAPQWRLMLGSWDLPSEVSASWTQCKGSEDKFRGYPCGLWSLFHTLLASASRSSEQEAREVLLSIAGYVRLFFGCRHCAAHFAEAAAHLHAEIQGSAPGGCVLWLWRAHNRANRRLGVASDASLDPQFPKVPFPTLQQCAACRTSLAMARDVRWDEDQVYLFLVAFYTFPAVAVGTTPPAPELVAADGSWVSTPQRLLSACVLLNIVSAVLCCRILEMSRRPLSPSGLAHARRSGSGRPLSLLPT